MNQMPSARGVAIAGDVYQHRHVLKACLEALHETDQARPNPTVAIGVEQKGLGNVDDLVKYREQPPHAYMQVKYAVDSTRLVDLNYLRDENLLQRLIDAHKRFTADGNAVEIRLVTNRVHDPTALLIRDRDGRDNRLAPRALEGTPRSNRGKARAEWARLAGTDVASVERFLQDFRLQTAVDVPSLLESIELLMTTLGMRSDESAVSLATNWVMGKVVEGTRRLTVDAIRSGFQALGLFSGERWATVSIATIKRDELASQALVAIDWVDKIEGDVERLRIQPRSPATWVDLQREVESIRQHLNGRERVLITGHMRQATGFLVGSALRSVVSGMHIAVRQTGQLWTSDGPIVPMELQVQTFSLGDGADVAVVLNASTDGTNAVKAWIDSARLPVGRMLTIAPAAGPNPSAVSTPDEARSLAVAIRDEIRNMHRPGVTHLFLIGPLGLSVLLGYYWNRVGRTFIYEHLGGREYVQAFDIDA